jgi:outer membrane protein OmpA-like peptidoglycan-associated protein
MKRMRVLSAGLLVLVFLFSFLFSCATTDSVTKHDKTAKGAGIGAAAGAVGPSSPASGRRTRSWPVRPSAPPSAAASAPTWITRRPSWPRSRAPTWSAWTRARCSCHFDSDVLFAVDSASLSGDARGALGQAASVMNEYDKTAVIVQGHTDSTGTEEHNQSLSERRASSVQTELVSRGVDRDRIASMGFGESQPVADNAPATAGAGTAGWT